MSEIEKKALKLWGDDLHKDYPASAHYIQLKHIFIKNWKDLLKGNLLEIGCGAGADLDYFSQVKTLDSIDAIDLGSSINQLSLKYKNREDINVSNGNALSLEFKEDSFDVVYSFGVFHHTENPIKCISEANRVLKKDGALFLYLYSAHEDIFLKRVGIFCENILMKLLKFTPYFFQHIVCILLSPICWIVFSIPARAFEYFDFKKASKKIPFYWGTHPFSLIGDLKDRLMSPVNVRFKKIEMISILKEQGFSHSEVVKTASGLYIQAIK